MGPDSGARDRAEPVLHSDAVYSAVCQALQKLGRLEEWLDNTARAEASHVRFSSLFPFAGDHLMVPPPRHVWPPPSGNRTRWKAARFIPLSLVSPILGQESLDDDAWTIDTGSECLIPAAWPSGSPFRMSLRSAAGVDRLAAGNIDRHATACLEYSDNCGLWCAVAFSDESMENHWSEVVRSAFRLLADSGLGGERSRGWGRSEQPRFEPLPEMPLADTIDLPESVERAYWLLSLFSPGERDQIDWARGQYTIVTRSGRAEGARWGDVKLSSRMVTEGSVILAGAHPRGGARDVAPEGYPHPIYRSGFAYAIPVPWAVQA